MIQSMTAFARTEDQGTWGSCVWELRSVNHRYFECSLRLPEQFRRLESHIRELLRSILQRGKVDISLQYRPASENTVVELNPTLVTQLQQAVTQVEASFSKTQPIDLIRVLQWPGLLQIAEKDIEEVERAVLENLEKTALQLKETRVKEGIALNDFLIEKLDAMSEEIKKIEVRMPTILEEQRNKLQTKIQEVIEQCDPNRLEQEIVYIAQKIDIVEEITRLKTHIEETGSVLKKGGSVGRRLDFMTQELNREANTIASKSVTTETTHGAVELKVLIEQIREQVQNIV